MVIEFLVYGLVFSYLKINTVLRRKQDSIQHFFWCLNINTPKRRAAWARTYNLGSIQTLHSCDAKWLKNHLSHLAEEPSHLHKHLVPSTKPPGHLYSTSKTMIWQEVERWLGQGPSAFVTSKKTCGLMCHQLYVRVALWSPLSQSFSSGAHSCLLHTHHTSTSVTMRISKWRGTSTGNMHGGRWLHGLRSA